MPALKTILVPTDFSAAADAALEQALGLAKLDGAELHLLHTYDLPVAVSLGSAPSIPTEFFDALRDAAEAKLAERVRRAEAAGVACKTHLVQGYASASIKEHADALEADLIVMGTRGISGLKHVMLGSVAERTVRTAPCPVMTVKEPAPE